jgi:hypothetical protein
MIKNISKIILIIFVPLLTIGCVKAWDELNVKNNDKYVISAIVYRNGQYYYNLNKIGEMHIIFDDYIYKSKEKYNIGDTIIVKVEKLK